MLPTVEESHGYDFQNPENAEKWRGIFVNALRKVLEQVHPTLTAEESALRYVESLCLRLLGMLCAVPSPRTVQDVEERVARSFPTPLDKWAVSDAREAVHLSAAQRRRRQLLPSDRLHNMLQKVLTYKIDNSVSVFMTAVLEYVSADILKLAGNFVKKISQKSGTDVITCSDIKTAMCADKVLMDMFYQDTELAALGSVSTGGSAVSGAGGTSGSSGASGTTAGLAGASVISGGVTGSGAVERRGRRGSLTYAELVRDLLTDEKNFLRDLNLIIRVFKEELEKILDKDRRMILLIFGNIMDIYEITVTLLGNLEDAIEMSQDSPTPYIGSCFEELAEVEEFRAYVRYANVVTKKESKEALQNIVDDPVLSVKLDTAGHGFRLAVKYFLPKLLMAPVAHVFLYHHYVLQLLHIACATDDRESFKQVECNLSPITKILMKELVNRPKMDSSLRMASRARRQLAIEKCNELARLVDNWDDRDTGQCCNEFVREDTLTKIGPGKRNAERRAYLFDGLLLLCKPVTSLSVVGMNMNSSSGGAGAGGAQPLKLKEKLHIRKLELVDRPDADEARHCVELRPREGPPVVLQCTNCVEKRNWMSDLIMLNTKPMLDRWLDSILVELERLHPLQLPPERLYRFAVPDSPDNLVLDTDPHRSHHPPRVKGATLLKLVERLTYHIYADLNLVRTFLTTYRSFCSPHELLDLLIERFNIPEPSEVYDTPRIAESIECVMASDADKLSKNTAREDWKRYRKEFQQPVKFRVINVIRHWVDQHFYDFERDPELLEKLREFLNSVDGKPMRKWVQSVLKTLQRKSGQVSEGGDVVGGVSHVFDRSPPAVLRHVADPERYGWHPLALHPLELARQLTLLEFQLYRQVKPSELVGAVWTKKDKETSSPNLLRMIKHTTNLTRWMEKWVVETENLEERAGVVTRLLELAAALYDLNNFNGVLAVVAALGSASVHRLSCTFQLVPARLVRALEEYSALNSAHFRRYQERLRSINPPCVPFFGMYLTNILHIEEGNTDFLSNTELINFSKRRKVAEITGEIQQYQNQPYCLTIEPRTRAFLESLDPFPGMDEIEIPNYLYEKSLEIEPRQPVKQLPKFPRKYPNLPLKPVKYTHRRTHHDHDDNISVSQLSPTSGSSWDSTSVSSLSLSHSEEHKSKQELVSPKLERPSGQFSLLDMGLALFDKSKQASLAASNKTINKDEPPSPRHDSRNSLTMERKPTLSPRNPIVDADTFYSRTLDRTSNSWKHSQERVPPLPARSEPEPRPPAPPPRPASPAHSLANHVMMNSTSTLDGSICSTWDSQERPLPSPKHQDIFRVSGMSPKRSPAPQPPISPLAQSKCSSGGGSGGAGVASSAAVFSFPGALSSSPSAHPHTHTPSPLHSRCGWSPGGGGASPPVAPQGGTASVPPAPPLPPRRRRDSTAPHTPLPPPHPPHAHQGTQPPTHTQSPPLASCSAGSGNLSPPPLPPRPPPAPALLRPAHSTILQRRHHNTSNLTPPLPPKPPPAAVAPRT